MSKLFDEAREKVSPSLIRSMFDSAGSYERTGEFYMLSPLRNDKNVGSFHINLSSGQWFDHGTDEGGDLIDLISLARNCSKKEAAEMIISESGGIYVEESDYKKEDVKEEGPDPVVIPDTFAARQSVQDTVKRKFFVDIFGEPQKIWRYFNLEKEWIFCVVKFWDEKNNKKNTILFYMAANGKWYSKGGRKKFAPFDPFHIETLSNKKEKILIVEGEKCADIKVPGYKVISWCGGSSAVRQTKWHRLKKFQDIIVWPDADSARDRDKNLKPYHEQPGIKAALYIKSVLPQAKILDVYSYIDIEVANGFDIADYAEKELDPLDFIEKFLPENSIDIPLDPLDYKDYFVKDYYGETGLRQFGGSFWAYDSGRHFWRKVIKNDIFCNMQNWLIQTTLQYRIKAKTEPTSFINKMKNYIDRHSVGYISDNPFLDAAIKPWVHFDNGAVNIKRGSLEWTDRSEMEEEYFRDLYPLTCLDFSLDFKDYKDVKPEKDCPLFYKFCSETIPSEYLKDIPLEDLDKEYKQSLDFFCQIMAYSLSPIKGNEYFFALWGKEGTGKSFFMEILMSIVGTDFCVIRPSKDTENNRFASAGLWGKKVYIEPDLKARKALNDDFIKAYAGEQTITVEEKNEPAKDGVKISLAMFFLSNYEFKTAGQEGLKRRIVLVPFLNEIPDNKKDRHMKNKILGKIPHDNGQTFDERPAITALILQALEEYQKNNNSFTVPKWANAAKEKWSIESNTVSSFLHNEYFDCGFSDSVSRPVLYDQYKAWCETEDRKPYGKMNFFQEMRLQKNVKEIKAGGANMFKIGESNEMEY